MLCNFWVRASIDGVVGITLFLGSKKKLNWHDKHNIRDIFHSKDSKKCYITTLRMVLLLRIKVGLVM